MSVESLFMLADAADYSIMSADMCTQKQVGTVLRPATATQVEMRID